MLNVISLSVKRWQYRFLKAEGPTENIVVRKVLFLSVTVDIQ
jgi:hypothetical protein